MLRRRQVAHEEDVVGPGEIRRVLRPADQKPPLGPPPRRLDEKRLERRLPVGRIGAEIRQVGDEPIRRRDRPMHHRIDVAVERRNMRRAKLRAQPVERCAAGVAQHEIEVS